jgi:hypothetical protein
MSFSSNKGLPKFVFGLIILNKLTRIPSPRTPVYHLSSPYNYPNSRLCIWGRLGGVTILDGQREIVERGEGIRGAGDWWEYVSNTEGQVVA